MKREYVEGKAVTLLLFRIFFLILERYNLNLLKMWSTLWPNAFAILNLNYI